MPQDLYRISVVSRQTGISIDKIRIWERRYGLVRPERDASGVRQYTSRDIERLRLAREATELGHPIGQVAAMDDTRIEHVIQSANAAAQKARDDLGGNAGDGMIGAILGAIERFDPVEAERILGKAAMLASPEDLVLDVVAPLMHEVGEYWVSGRFTVAQEHLTSHLVRNLLGSLARFKPPSNGEVMLFATPPGDPHEFGIMLAANLAGLRGIQTYVLGADVPLDDLLETAYKIVPSAVIVAATIESPDDDVSKYVASLDDRLPRSTELFVAGQGAGALRDAPHSSRVAFVETLRDFARRLPRYSGAPGTERA